MIDTNRYGFILFNEDINQKENIKNNIMGGIACIHGQDPFEFKQIKELPKNIIWYSNLTKDGIWRTGQWHNIKSKFYLGISFEALYSNLINHRDKFKLVKSFAFLFTQVMYALEKYVIDNGLEFKIGKNELFEDLYEQFMGKSFNPKTPEELRYRFGESYIEQIKIPNGNSINANNSNNTFTFLIDHNFYVEEILSETLPIGKWTELNEFKGNKQPSKLLKEKIILDKNAKFFIKIDELIFHPSLNQNWGSLWLGSRGALLNGTIIDELWLTEKEFLFLIQYADFKVLEVWQNTETTSIKDFYFKKLFKKDLILENIDLRHISMVYQILSRLFIKSFMSTGYHPVTREKFPFTENMIWFRAKERELLFNIAKKMVEEFNYKIKNFGNGEITIYLEQQDKQKLIQFLLSQNLFIPMALAQEEIPNKKNLQNLFINEYLHKDFKLKHKYINRNLEEDYFNFINQLSFIYKNNKEEKTHLLSLVSKLKFSSQDEQDEEYKWFLNELNNVLTKN